MPWMPEVFTAAPIADPRRSQGAAAVGTNDAVAYYEGIMADEPDALVRSFARQQSPSSMTPAWDTWRGSDRSPPSSPTKRPGCAAGHRGGERSPHADPPSHGGGGRGAHARGRWGEGRTARRRERAQPRSHPQGGTRLPQLVVPHGRA